MHNDPTNAQADVWWIGPKRGVGKIDYGGVVRNGVWYRLALVIDTVAGAMSSYIDGRRVQNLSIEYYNAQARFPLRSTVFLFASKNEQWKNEMNASGWVNSVQIRNYDMKPTEIAALGGPTAAGIPLPQRSSSQSERRSEHGQ